MPGGGMPEVVSKGPIFTRLDGVLSNPTVRQQLLNDLRALAPADAAGLAHLGLTYNVFTNANEEKHFLDDWLTNWWPSAQPLAPLIREALIATIEVATGASNTPRAGQNPLPVDCYWVCHPGHTGAPMPDTSDGDVEGSITWSAQQVTFIMHTPEAPGDMGSDTGTEPILVVKRNKKAAPIIRVQP